MSCNTHPQAAQLQTSTAALRDEIDRLTTQLETRLNFDYKDPERGFDRGRVKGLVAKLITVANPRNATALEVTAGGKLYQVVVDTEVTSKLLIQKGQLRSRVTILPLNKLNSRAVAEDKLALAKELATAKGSTATLALELVGFAEDVRKAMEHTFGNVIVCGTADVAKEIAFHAKIRNKTVTLEGDVFDPAGTMSGGAKSQIGSLLGRMSDLAAAREALAAQQSELTAAEDVLSRLETQGAAAKDVETELELKRHALKMSEEKLADSDYAQISTEIASLEGHIASHEEESAALRTAHEHANGELKKLKDAEKNVKKAREAAMKDLENQMKNSAKTATKVREGLTTFKNRRDTLAAEVDALRRDVSSLGEQLAISRAAVERIGNEAEGFQRKLSDIKSKYEAAKAAKVHTQPTCFT
jgi:structural maintenance of chromosome 2